MSSVVSVVFASDEVTAMPMGIAIKSLLEYRAPETTLDVHVISCGISERNRLLTHEMFASDQSQARLTWHDMTAAQIKKLESLYDNSDRPYPPANYARLLVGEVLPAAVERVIYMDMDTISRVDLAPLTEIPFEGNHALVIRDLPHDTGNVARLNAVLKGDDVDKYTLSEDHRYFQAGVVVLDVAAFRNGLAEEIFGFLRRYPELTFPDQDALNVVLSKTHKHIDPRWNQMTAAYWYKGHADSPYSKEVYGSLLSDPYIVHYSGRPKPWENDCTHAYASDWEALFESSPWKTYANSILHRIENKFLRVKRVLGKKFRRLNASK